MNFLADRFTIPAGAGRAVSRRIGANITGCEIWSTDRMPVDNSPAAEPAEVNGELLRTSIPA